MSEPESIDPIYKDLVSTLEKKKADLEMQIKKRQDLEKKMSSAAPHSPELRAYKKDYSTCIQNIHALNQIIQYHEIRAERRKYTSRMNYQIAYNSKKQWPDEEEFKLYQANKRLKEAPRDWNERVPKMTDRYPSSKPKKAQKSEAEKTSEEGGEPKKSEEGHSEEKKSEH